MKFADISSATNNPHVSQEAKNAATERLDQMGEHDVENSGEDEQHLQNVAAGLKA